MPPGQLAAAEESAHRSFCSPLIATHLGEHMGIAHLCARVSSPTHTGTHIHTHPRVHLHPHTNVWGGEAEAQSSSDPIPQPHSCLLSLFSKSQIPDELQASSKAMASPVPSTSQH